MKAHKRLLKTQLKEEKKLRRRASGRVVFARVVMEIKSARERLAGRSTGRRRPHTFNTQRWTRNKRKETNKEAAEAHTLVGVRRQRQSQGRCLRGSLSLCGFGSMCVCSAPDDNGDAPYKQGKMDKGRGATATGEDLIFFLCGARTGCERRRSSRGRASCQSSVRRSSDGHGGVRKEDRCNEGEGVSTAKTCKVSV